MGAVEESQGLDSEGSRKASNCKLDIFSMSWITKSYGNVSGTGLVMYGKNLSVIFLPETINHFY